ncbi:hypothetical protein CONLIGDRAFT_287751 [Coniochaeta ligniaria NRRL 30616]|uniref:Secreted protein n=1 Tax=Coniochaeta ligniaria NRRL 30616 TaxID=1408157 RepID=A0A1J7JSD9_9PEZI|nr:hypothetical protein CONLIGDRAFT_287751 [Coniochaeta ligniaria NRRL 30616]
MGGTGGRETHYQSSLVCLGLLGFCPSTWQTNSVTAGSSRGSSKQILGGCTNNVCTQHRTPTRTGPARMASGGEGSWIVTADFIKGADVAPHHHGTVLSHRTRPHTTLIAYTTTARVGGVYGRG